MHQLVSGHYTRLIRRRIARSTMRIGNLILLTADHEENCGETANVSPLKAEEPEEVRRIDEDLPRLAEAGLSAELAPVVCSLGKVAGGDVVPDLVPLGRR